MDEDKLAQVMREFGDRANARAVFGEAEHVGDRTIIPVAQVSWGSGSARGPRFLFLRRAGAPTAAEAVPTPPEAPPPGATGGWVRAKPIALVEIGPEGTRVRPIRDTTRLAIGMFMLVGWSVYWITRTLREIFGRR